MGKKASHSVEINSTPDERDEPLTQVERFRRVAQELGCDEDEAAFDATLRRIAGYKPGEPPPAPVKPAKSKARPGS